MTELELFDAARAAGMPATRAAHYVQYGVRAEEPCEVCGGKAGERECGCWGDVDRYVYCLACSDLSGHTSHHTDYPCQTVLLLDEIDAAVRGEE